MSRQQENTIERLTLVHGSVAVREGYDDGGVRVSAPNGHHWRVLDDDLGTPVDAGVDFSLTRDFITDRLQ